MNELVPTAAQVVPDNPDAQVADTIQLMRRYATEDAASPAIQMDAAGLSKDLDPVEAVFAHVRDRMRFTRDEDAAQAFQDQYPYPIVEILIRPRDLAAIPYPRGDCDDFTMYGAALLLALGVPCAFVTVAADPHAPDAYSHVYLAAYPRTGQYAGRRVPLDLSHGSYAGWETDQVINGKRTEWPVGGSVDWDAVGRVGLRLLTIWSIGSAILRLKSNHKPVRLGGRD